MRLRSVKLLEVGIFVSILVCSGSIAAPQTAATVKSAVDRPRVRVILGSFKQIGPTTSGRGFAAFFRTLTALQLRSLRGLRSTLWGRATVPTASQFTDRTAGEPSGFGCQQFDTHSLCLGKCHRRFSSLVH